jgi:glycosyltransferase involved in cell wall biosynthesis/O-antigen/teichoic acid export membrane protein
MGGKVGFVLINAATGIITARALHPAGRGELAALGVWPNFLGGLMTFGLPSALVFWSRSEPDRKSSMLWASVPMTLLLSAIAMAIGIIGIPFWLSQYPPHLIHVAQLFMINAVVVLLIANARAACESEGDFLASSIALCMTPFFAFVGLVALQLTHRLDPVTGAGAYIVSGVPACLYLISRLRQYFVSRPTELGLASKKLLSYGIRSYGVDICGTLAVYADQAIVVHLLSPTAMGTYVVALSLSRVLNIIHQAVASVLFPKAVSVAPVELLAMTGRALRVSTLCTAICGVGVAFLGPFLLGLLYGKDYRGATLILNILIGEVILTGATLVLTSAYRAFGRPGLVTILQASGLVFSLPLLAVMVPRWGVTGAASALLTAAVIRFVLTMVSFRFVLGLPAPSMIPRIDELKELLDRFLIVARAFANRRTMNRQESNFDSLRKIMHQGGRPMRSESLTLFISFPTKPLTDWLPNGDGLIAFQTILELAKRGHTLHVATPYADLKYPVPPRVTVYSMQERSDDPRPGALAYMLWTRRTLNRIRKHTRIDLIHELNPVFSLRSLAFVGSNLPVALGPHSSRWPLGTGGSLMRRAQRLFTSTFKDICVHQQHIRASAILLSTKAALNNVKKPERVLDRLFILPPGIDAEVFSPAEEVMDSAPTVLYLANVVARKGIFSLLEAFARLANDLPEVRMIIGGDGSDLPAAKAIVATSTYADRVEFVGRVQRGDIPGLMRRCTVYCLPSYGEPFGMTAIEAMACGKPLVVTDAGGLGYMVSNQGGRRVPVKDPAALAEALEELLRDPELCAQMGKYNRSEVERLYAWPVVASRIEGIYRQVLGLESSANPDRLITADLLEYRSRLDSKPLSMRGTSTLKESNHGVISL